MAAQQESLPRGATHTLEAHGLYKRYRSKIAVDHVSLRVSTGEVIGLLGTNGAGKTTCFDMIVGLLRIDGGEVLLDGRSLTNRAMHVRTRLGLGYLPQEPSVFRGMTSEDNLLAVLELRSDLARGRRRDVLERLIEEFHLQGVRRLLGKQLSGGERRRLEFARALAMSPTFLLLDEPFAGVDPITVDTVKQQIRLVVEDGVGVLITDHNVRDTLEICDRAYILHRGRILAEGPPQKLVQDELVRRTFLGTGFTM